MLTLIAAFGQNYALGKNNKLLWHLPADFQHFKKITSGHCIIMGRKTFESLPNMLPNRTHIIISRQKKFKVEGAIVVSSIEKAIEKAYEIDENPFVIGGGEIYKLAMPLAHRLEITRVLENFEADTFFPEIDENQWELIEKTPFLKDEKHVFNFIFETYQKINTPNGKS